MSDPRLLDGTHPSAARFGIFIFLLFGMFYAILGAVGLMGVPCAEGMTSLALI